MVLAPVLAAVGPPTAGFAQEVLFAEDFSNGMPAGWTNVDASGQGASWTWCPDPDAVQIDGCPNVWSDGINHQVPFAATTAQSGFVTLDSDHYGNLPLNHVSELTTSAIDLSATDVARVEFQSHIGVFTVPASTGALFRVSTDLQHWTVYTPFPTLTTAARWSANPTKSTIDISATAAHQDHVYLQWQWTGRWEYQWSLDDVRVLGPSPVSISATKTVSPGPHRPGDTVEYEIVLSNEGDAEKLDAPGPDLQDSLPSGLEVLGWSASSGTVTGDLQHDQVFWNGAIPGHAQIEVTIEALVATDHAGKVSNQAQAFFDVDGDGEAESEVDSDEPGIAGPSDPTDFCVLPPLGENGIFLDGFECGDASGWSKLH